MKSHKIDVIIKRGKKQVFDIPNSLSIRKLPSGSAGVIHHGRVYPLHEDGSIDTAGISFDPDECSSPIPLTSPMPPIMGKEEKQNLSFEWHHEANDWIRYLAFDGDTNVKDLLVSEFSIRGISILKVGRSFRKSSDGRQYRWYIKLKPEVSEDVAQQIAKSVSSKSFINKQIDKPEIESYIGRYPWERDHAPLENLMIRELAFLTPLNELLKKYGATYEGIINNLGWLWEHMPGWINEISGLSQKAQKLREAKNEDRELVVSLKKKNEQNRFELIDLKRTINLQEIQLNTLKKEIVTKGQINDDLGKAPLRMEIEALKKENANLRDDLLALNDIAAEEEKKKAEQLRIMEEENTGLRAENSILKIKNLESISQSNPNLSLVPSSKNRSIELVQRAAETFLPRLVLNDHAYETIVERFSDSSDLFKHLYSFDTQQKIRQKSIKGTDGWFELDVHIRTGRDNMGRIYFRRQGSKNKYDVYIHHKENDIEQDKLFEKLDGMSPFRRE
jgi:hypothetical protein